jgi:hypothetical protein
MVETALNGIDDATKRRMQAFYFVVMLLAPINKTSRVRLGLRTTVMQGLLV